MQWRPIFSKLLLRAHSNIYSGTLRDIVRKTGLNRLISKPYWKFMYSLSGRTQTHKVAGSTTDFRTSTFTEFMRFRDLGGERPVIEDVVPRLQEDDVFYDIGANVGTYTCFAASKLGPDGAFAYEPEPANANRLRENLKLNGLDAEVIEVALSDTDGRTVELALSGGEAGEGEHAIATSTDGETIKVETARGDTIIERRDLPKPTVVKVDVEGAELSVLRGLEGTLSENGRLAYVEVHPEKITGFGDRPSEVTEFLSELGFKTTEIAHRGNEVFLRASK